MTYITGYQGEFNPSRSAVIDILGTISDSIPCGGLVLTGITLPSLFTGTALTFLVSPDEDGFQAQGNIQFTDTPGNGDTISINGVVLTFVTSSPGANQILIGGNPDACAENLQLFLNATTDVDLLACSYETISDHTIVTANAKGVSGNDIVLATDSAAINLTNMSGGGFRPLYDDTNTIVSMTVAAARAYAVDSSLFQGVSFLQIQSNASEAGTRIITCSLKGF